MTYIVRDNDTQETMEIAKHVFEKLIVKSKEQGLQFVINNKENTKEIVINL